MAIFTPKGRLAFCQNLLDMGQFMGEGRWSYSTLFLFPKKMDAKDQERFEILLEAIREAGLRKYPAAMVKQMEKTGDGWPIKSADTKVRREDGSAVAGFDSDHWYLTAKAGSVMRKEDYHFEPPEVVLPDAVTPAKHVDVWAGRNAEMAVRPYPYSPKAPAKGVALALNSVHLLPGGGQFIAAEPASSIYEAVEDDTWAEAKEAADAI